MPSISVSDAEKAVYASVIDDLHSIHQRDITVIHEKANEVITDDGNFNAFSDRDDPAISYTAETTTIPARIKYLDKAEDANELIFAGGGGGKVGGTAAPLTIKYGVIRIKVAKEYNSLVETATKIIVDGIDCQFIMNYTPQSLFNTNYTVFYLARQK